MAAPGGSGSVGELPVPQPARGGIVAQSVAWRRAKACAAWNDAVKLSLAKPSATLELQRAQLKGVDVRAAGTAVAGVDVALSREPARVPRTHARTRARTHARARARSSASAWSVVVGMPDDAPSLA